MVIHIGFPKTGTSTQQKHLFSRHSQIEYLGKPYPNEEIKAEIHKMIMQESQFYDALQCKSYISNLLVPVKNSQKVILLSDELFVSASKARDKGVVAQRLKEVLYPCRILVTIRNQLEIDYSPS